MINNLDLVIENTQLKTKIKLYEISTKSDYEKINKLLEQIELLKNINNLPINK